MKKIMILFAAVFSMLVINAQSQEDDRAYIVKVGDTAPDFRLNLIDGRSVQLSALKGKLVMLQFTASWCSVCRKEMPFIEKDIWQKHKDDPDFALFAIDREEPIGKVYKLIGATGITYPVALDPEAKIFDLYARHDAGITRNVLIDKDGRIIMLTRLYNEEEFSKLTQLIDKMLSN